jgi:hypothetical protein
MSARDRKIAMIVAPLLVMAGYWFLILGPKRSTAAQAGAALSKAEQRRDRSVSRVSQLDSEKARFGQDYEAVVKLGKAIPISFDMPSLIVQLDKAARGTRIRFDKISTATQGSQPGASSSPSGSSGPQSGSTGSQSNSSKQSAPPAGPDGKAAAGGAGAESGPGRATETAGNKVNKANSQSAAGEKGATAPGAGSAGSGGSAAAPGTGSAQGPAPPGLVGVPLTFTFTGSFFELADFFHALKRFVRAGNNRIEVRGRLMTVDSFNFTGDDSSGRLKAEVSATVYLAPKDEGPTGGATAAGPGGTTASTSDGGGAPGPSPPAATATR